MWWRCDGDVVERRSEEPHACALSAPAAPPRVPGRGEEYVDQSEAMLVFLSRGYLDSTNCVRELLRAIACGMPMILMLEGEQRHGGMTDEEMREGVIDAVARYSEPDSLLHAEMLKWGVAPPTVDELMEILQLAEGRSPGDRHHTYHKPLRELCVETAAERAARTSILEWERIGSFQDVVLRLVVERLLPAQHPPTFLPQELAFQEPRLPALPPGRFHVYCSPHNPGAEELLLGLRDTHAPALQITTDLAQLGQCRHALVYLHARTWSHESAELFEDEVFEAQQLGVHLLLAHEALGVEGSAPPRHACEFDKFFDVTSAQLLKAGIYSEMAIPLKQMPCRAASMVMLVKALATDAARPAHDRRLSSASRLGAKRLTLSRQPSEAESPTPGRTPVGATPLPNWLLSACTRCTKGLSDAGADDATSMRSAESLDEDSLGSVPAL